MVPVAGEDASATRLRERIEFSSNILFFIEDLYLALGPGHVTTQSGAKINVVASLLWVRNQHAANLKELMIAKKTGWQVLRNFKSQQHTGERKQMAKAIAAVNKSSKPSSFKKRPSTPGASAPPPKRRSFQPERTVTCFNCQQPGHIAPRCPSRPASSTPAPKATPKK